MIIRRNLDWPSMSGWSPFTEIDRLWREMDYLLSSMEGQVRRQPSAGVFPLVNITEDPENYYVRAELPGIKSDDINLSVVGNSLSICGKRMIIPEPENARYHRRERETGAFRRAVSFSSNIDRDKVEARCKDGVLTITLPKTEEAKPRQISVKVE